MFKSAFIAAFSFLLIPQPSALAANLKENILLERTIKSVELLAGWNPIENRQGSKNKAGPKTMISLKKFKQMPELETYFNKAAGFAIFPNISKGGFGIGGARGKGEVFQGGKVIGATTVTQVSIGFQLGGQAFSQIIFFRNKRDINRFTEGGFEFEASASAALINAGVAKEAAYSNGVAVMTVSKGGLMYEASIGGQKFNFSPY